MECCGNGIFTSLSPSVINIVLLKWVRRSSGDTRSIPVDIFIWSLQYADSSRVLRSKKASLSQLG